MCATDASLRLSTRSETNHEEIRPQPWYCQRAVCFLWEEAILPTIPHRMDLGAVCNIAMVSKRDYIKNSAQQTIISEQKIFDFARVYSDSETGKK